MPARGIAADQVAVVGSKTSHCRSQSADALSRAHLDITGIHSGQHDGATDMDQGVIGRLIGQRHDADLCDPQICRATDSLAQIIDGIRVHGMGSSGVA